MPVANVVCRISRRRDAVVRPRSADAGVASAASVVSVVASSLNFSMRSSGSQNRRPDPHNRGAFLDGHLEVAAQPCIDSSRSMDARTPAASHSSAVREAVERTAARLRVCPARAAASSARPPRRRGARPRHRRAAVSRLTAPNFVASPARST